MRSLLRYLIIAPIVLGAIVVGGLLDGWLQIVFGIVFFGLLGYSVIRDLPGSFGNGDSRDPWLDDGDG